MEQPPLPSHFSLPAKHHYDNMWSTLVTNYASNTVPGWLNKGCLQAFIALSEASRNKVKKIACGDTFQSCELHLTTL